jgi:hypothetical protein
LIRRLGTRGMGEPYPPGATNHFPNKNVCRDCMRCLWCAWGGRVPKPTCAWGGACVCQRESMQYSTCEYIEGRKQIHLISSSFPASLDSGNQSRRSLHTPAQRSASVYIYLLPHLNPSPTPSRRPNETSRGVRVAMATDEPLAASPLASLLICLHLISNY